MKAQEIFDSVYNHIMKQGPSKDGRFCMYRDSRGNKCAVGLFIKDEDYKLDLEFKAVLFNKSVLDLIPDIDGEYSKEIFYSKLQKCHDEASNKENFKEVFSKEMKKFANEFSLEFKDK